MLQLRERLGSREAEDRSPQLSQLAKDGGEVLLRAVNRHGEIPIVCRYALLRAHALTWA